MAFVCIALVFLAVAPLHAQLIQFRLNRFGGISVQTAAGKERVRIYQGDKQGEETLFDSRLKMISSGAYTTPDGIRFELKRLANAVVNDANRRLDSGDWQLTISGSGAKFERLKEKMPFVAFGNLRPLTYLGEVDK